MKDLQYKVFPSEVLKADDKTLTIEHFISTETKDFRGDIMRADGMRQRGRVVVMKNHGYGDGNEEPIAKPLGIRVGAHPNGTKGLIAITKYYDGSGLTPPDNTGQRLYEKAKGGYMPNWSIGYKAITFTVIDEGRGRDVTEWDLHEYSQVPVGMNEEATCAEEYKTIGGIPRFVLEAADKDSPPTAKEMLVAYLTKVDELIASVNDLKTRIDIKMEVKGDERSILDIILSGDAPASDKPAGTGDDAEMDVAPDPDNQPLTEE